MTALRAIQKYEEILRGFQNRLSRRGTDTAGVLELGFGFLFKKLNLQGLAVFWWNADSSTLQMQYAFRDGILMEGEEEIEVHSHSAFWPLVQEQVPVVTSQKRPWISYIPLVTDKKLIGAVRLERKHILPQGRILRRLPRIHPNESRGDIEFPILEDVADILSNKIQELVREDNHQKRALYLKAGSEVAVAVVERPRLREMLEAVSRSIVSNLGFDRIRFFLVDPSHSELKGVLGLQIPDRLLDLSGEKYPLNSNVNRLVDAVIKPASEIKLTSAGGRIVFVPLQVGGQIIGCMAVDNLLSQIVIDSEQMNALRSLTGQIGMAVMNARLFEDIEQQAITDGLTKLYVYRYFQQRLKEELDRADRYSYSVALIMMDVDNFKNFNDTYGHALGDKVLEYLAQIIRTNIRRIDLAARYGGDEFILLLPEITEQEAWLMGTRLLNALKDSTILTPSGEKIHIRVTLGVSMYVSDARNSHDLMEAADRALYWAKKNNRGEICFYRDVVRKAEKLA